MLELEDTLDMYGLGIEDASNIEEDYYEYNNTFTDNRLYQKVVSEVRKEIFNRFCVGDKDLAIGAYHEMQGLMKVLSKLQEYEAAFQKVQAIKDANGKDIY